MLNNEVIVIIDDDADDLELAHDALRMLNTGKTIRLFDAAATFLKYITDTNDQIFVIICDVNMPAINGFELRKIIIEDEKLMFKCSPFLFYTTHANLQSVTEAYLFPVQGFFIKPSSFDGIKKELARIISFWGHNYRPEASCS